MTFAKEAVPFVLPFLLLALITGVMGRTVWLSIFFALGIGVLLFFRIPARDLKAPPEAVFAAANGRVTKIDRVTLPEADGAEFQRIVTFLSVFNIHVQRTPISGEVIGAHYTPGKKVAAFREDADLVNENHLLVMRSDQGDTIAIRQIAGLVARRVVCKVGVGESLQRGDLFGLIKFGSRVDLMLPLDYQIDVAVGDTLHEGLTVVARSPTQ